MALPPKVYQFLVGVFASLGSFLFGYDLTIIAEVIAAKSFTAKFTPSASETGAVVALFTGGAFFGAGFASPSSDHLGRRATILAGAIIFCLGGALQAGAANIAYLFAGRFLAGVGVGFLTMIVPLYQAELAHPDIRGLVTGLQQFMLGIGGVCGAWISYGTYVSYTDNRQFRIPLGLQIVPAAILGLLIFLFPESPRWLISKGRTEEGLNTLAKLHAHGDVNSPWVMAEYEQISEQVTYERENEAKSYKELFSNRANVRRVMLAMAAQAACQMTGVSAIQYYSVTIFEQIGISGKETLKYQAINSIIGLFGEFLLMVLVDRIGRRWILIGGNALMGLTFIISTILLAKFPPETNSTGAHWGFVIMTWLFTFAFGSTAGPLSWIIPAEIFDTATRAKGVSIAAMTSFAFNTMIGQVTGIGMKNVRWRFYILFCVTNFTNALFFWAFLPETKKLPLEEMQNLFSKALWFVPTMDAKMYQSREITARAEEYERKGREEDGEGEGEHVEHKHAQAV